MNIYKSIRKPVFSLAPMEDVTDTVFRQVVSSVGSPDLFYTEFVNVEGLNSKGRDRVIHRLRFEESEKPIVAQLWGIEPKNFFNASKIVKEMGFDGIDINMGCSINKIATRGAGSGLIKSDPSLAKDIVAAVKNGSSGLPVSVKTRLGWEEVDVEGWLGFLLDQSLDALTVHMRTARGASAVKANWEHAKALKELRDRKGVDTLLFGNGDITSKKMAQHMINEYGLDGVMVGRSVINNPWFFSGRENVPLSEKLNVMKKHIQLFEITWGETKDVHSLKKFFRGYINGFDGASEVRERLMKCESTQEYVRVIDDIKNV